MKQFLSELADIYCNRYGDELHQVCFVFPGKRAGRFFLQHITNLLSRVNAGHPVMLPQITTISELAEQISGRIVDSRIDMLFVLYQEYCKLQPSGVKAPDFDRFRAWGDTILSDFNDVDMYLADAEKLFKNLADYKEIQTDYLTDEQKKVLNKYFGDTFSLGQTARFWKNFKPQNGKKDTKQKFLYIWESLYPLYTAFNKRLADEGMSYAGASYRIALEKLRECENIPALLQCRRIVFVGFNVLSTAEFHLFSLLRDTKLDDGSSFADFYWDATGPAMNDKQNTATKFIDVNRKEFPSAYPLTQSNNDLFPADIDVYGCPSNSIQAKVIYEIIQKQGEREEFNQAMEQARVAIVLPDENLLMPMLYSLPDNVKSCNVTMGYPLKMTSIASFLSLIRRMQMRRRIRRGVVNFFYEDVSAVLQHPISNVLFSGEKIQRFVKDAIEQKLFLIDTEILNKVFGEQTILFTPADDRVLIQDGQAQMHYPTTAYIYRLMSDICSALRSDKSNALVRNSLDYDNAQLYMQTVSQLDDTLNRREIDTSMSQIFKLTDRLLSSEQVTIQGEPLMGLQIMGMLETRGIDFDYVIIPSMNEKIFPRKSHKRSFIPNTLRIGYGLATTHFEESIFAYNFYRLISRARSVNLLYDTRTGGTHSGDISRYILQLQYLYNLDPSRIHQISFDTVDTTGTNIEIPKTPEVQALLSQYIVDKSSNTPAKALSASALKKYLTCPLKFYFSALRKLQPEQTLSEFISPIDQGNIFHKAMENIYKELPANEPQSADGKYILKPETIQSWLGERWIEVDTIINKTLSEYYNNQFTPGQKDFESVGEDIKMYLDILKRYVTSALQADLMLARKYGCIIYHHSELKEYVEYSIPDGPTINTMYIIDRLDELGTDNPLLRISDYKTGRNDKPELAKVEDMFNKDENHAIFQLMLYANLYSLKHQYSGATRLDIYRTVSLHVQEYDTSVKHNGKPYLDYQDINKEFLEILNAKLQELFDDSVSFKATENKGACRICEFKQLCAQVK